MIVVDFPAWFPISFLCLVELILLMVASARQTSHTTEKNKRYVAIVVGTFITLLADMISRCYIYSWFPILIYIFGTYVKYMMLPIMVVLTIRYILIHLTPEQQKGAEYWVWICIALCCINGAFVLSSMHNGLLFYFDENMMYHRGPLYIVSVAIISFMLVGTAVMVLHRGKQQSRSFAIRVGIFQIPAFFGIALQAIFYGLPFSMIGITVTLISVYVAVQNQNVDVDYMTGLFNRNKFDMYLITCARSADNGNEGFSALLLDLDDFKRINDQYGHVNGDRALKDLATVLTSIKGNDDFLARFGGDEFCWITKETDHQKLMELVEKIRKDMVLFNRKSHRPYKLHASIGAATYLGEMKEGTVSFIKRLDEAMYQDKLRLQKSPQQNLEDTRI